MLLLSRLMSPIIILSTIVILLYFPNAQAAKVNFFDTLDPRSPNIEKILKQLDADYEKITGKSAHLYVGPLDDFFGHCYRNS